MIKAVLFNSVDKSVISGGQELIESWQENPDTQIWLDIDGLRAAEERPFLEKFNIHPLAIQDALRKRHPPKIEFFDDYIFLLYKGLDAGTEGIEFGAIQLSLFIGKRFLITRHNKPSVSAQWLQKEVSDHPSLMSKGPAALAIKLSNRLVRRYVEILLDLEPRLDAIEEEMFENPNDRLLSELTRYKSKLRQLARIATYHEQVITKLKQDKLDIIGTHLSHEVVDVYEQVERTKSLSLLYYEIARDLTDSYLALSSHRLNNVMQVLTVITVIFVPLTFLAGIYGMNFINMPELQSGAGYFVVLAVMFVAAIIQLVIFRRKGWV